MPRPSFLFLPFFLFLSIGRSDGQIPIAGPVVPELSALDNIVQTLLTEHDIPGASLSVSKDGRLIYTRGFGWADAEHKEPVEPDSLFRIASISKPITAVAIFQLIELGKLRLDDRVLDILQLKPAESGDPRFVDITIRQCLAHTGGWDRAKSFDPMFRSVLIARTLKQEPPAKAQDVIQYMLGIPLDFAPGERYAYSNFGYCLLGRVIEKVTGEPYDEHVRDTLLAPLGIRRMQIGHSLLAERAKGEVMYHDSGRGPAVLGKEIGQEVPHPYGAWYLEAMDSHGGWIASSADLVRFAAALGDSARSPLKPESLATMFARVDKGGDPTYYACGWNVRVVADGKFNAWHTGSLPGTSTILVRRHDGVCWSVLFNRRDGRDAKRMSAHAHERIDAQLDQVNRWPAPLAAE